MPTVPEYNGGVAPTTFPQAQFAVTPANAPESIDSGKQLTQLGDSLQKAGGDVVAIQNEMQAHINQVRAIEAHTALQEYKADQLYRPNEGALQQSGRAAFEPADGGYLPDTIAKRIQDKATEISAGLTPAQQRLFAPMAQSQVVGAYSTVSEHVAAQNKTYAIGTFTGAAESAARSLALSAMNGQVGTNPATGLPFAQPFEDQILASEKEKARLQGLPAEVGLLIAQKSISTAHREAVDAFLEKNQTNTAQAYFAANKDKMLANDLLHVSTTMDKMTNQQIGMAAAQKVATTFQTNLNPPPIATGLSVIAKLESGGNHFSEGTSTNQKGQITRSPSTDSGYAYGMFQMQPATAQAAAKKAGIPWNPDLFMQGDTGDPAKNAQAKQYHAALSTAILDDLARKFDGNKAMILAAYHAGPGVPGDATKGGVFGAIAKAKAAGDTPDNFLKYLGPNTNAYVAKGLPLWQDQQGQPLSKPTLQDLLAQGDGLRSNPIAYKTFVDQTTQAYEVANKAQTQKWEEAKVAAQKGLEGNGGNFYALPPSVRNVVNPKDVPELQEYAGKIYKGQDSTDDAVFFKVSNDSYLKSLTPVQVAALKPSLSSKHFEQISAQYQDLKSGKVSVAADTVDTGAVSSSVERLENSLGLGLHFLSSDSDKQAAGVRRTVAVDAILRKQQATGKKLSPAEVDQEVAGMFAKTKNYRDTFLGIETGTNTSARPFTLTEAPSDFTNALNKARKLRGQPEANQQEALTLYLKSQLK